MQQLTVLNQRKMVLREMDDLNEQEAALKAQLPAETVCSQFLNCGECATNDKCGWCSVEHKCVEGNSKGPLANADACSPWEFSTCASRPCNEYSTCRQCS